MLCEACAKEPATVLSCNRERGWQLAGNCIIGDELYYIGFEWYNQDPERWLSHLREKNWFNEEEFLAAVKRMSNESA